MSCCFPKPLHMVFQRYLVWASGVTTLSQWKHHIELDTIMIFSALEKYDANESEKFFFII